MNSRLSKLNATDHTVKDLAGIIKQIALSAAAAGCGRVAEKVVEETTNMLWYFVIGTIKKIK